MCKYSCCLPVDIPQVVYRLQSLTTLFLRFNRIRTIDPALRNLTVSPLISLLKLFVVDECEAFPIVFC